MITSIVTTAAECFSHGVTSGQCGPLAAECEPCLSPQHHHFELDLKTSSIRRSDARTLQLIREEAAVLAGLLKQPRKPLSCNELLSVLNKDQSDYPLAKLNAHLFRLRQKLIMFDGRLVVSHARRMSYSYIGPDIQVVSF